MSKDGKAVWLQSAYSPIKDSNGEIVSILKLASDITKKNESISLANTLRNTVDLSFGYIQFDPNGVILDLNNNFAELLGYDVTEVIGSHHSIFVEHSYASTSSYSKFWEELRNGSAQKGEFKRLTKNKKEVWIQAAYTPIVNDVGAVISIIKIAADVTSSKAEALKAKDELKNELYGNVTEITSAIGEMASGARTQAEKIDQSSANLESSLESSKSVSVKAGQIADAAQNGKQKSEQGTQYVDELVNEMSVLTETSAKTQAAMDQLAKRTEEIKSILNIIQGIANDTNLLALNASIEAAQAGDSGRGFSVIAQEIRKLAENARDSVKEIEEKMAAMSVDTEEVTKTVGEMTTKISESEKATESVKNIFDHMVDSTEKTSQLSGEIVKDSTKQKEQLGQIVSNSEDIVVISEETAAGAEQISAASKDLENQIANF